MAKQDAFAALMAKRKYTVGAGTKEKPSHAPSPSSSTSTHASGGEGKKGGVGSGSSKGSTKGGVGGSAMIGIGRGGNTRKQRLKEVEAEVGSVFTPCPVCGKVVRGDVMSMHLDIDCSSSPLKSNRGGEEVKKKSEVPSSPLLRYAW
mmetsp:Transcript_40822/g.105922  ORF Transcript_40822/g.105922 Transcript_40822/m.105922 type:complete len:147 (-) Transcript_40822:191-631(-)